MKWHKLQRREEKLVNAWCEEEILKARECLREVLKDEASREAKRSQCFQTNILCVSTGTKNEGQSANIVIEDEGRIQTLNSVLGEDETVESHVHAHTQLSELQEIYNRMKKEVHYVIIWKVKNDESKDSEVLQYKVWKTGRLQPKETEDSEDSG